MQEEIAFRVAPADERLLGKYYGRLVRLDSK